LTHFDHLFVSPGGALLPAWLEAFAGARGAASGTLAGTALPAALVWLRLEHGVPLQVQVAAVRAHCGELPIVVMSDTPDDDEALSALAAQARGYCNTHAGADILTKVASVVSQGGLWIGEALMHRILAVQQHIRLPQAAARPDWRATLTAREVEVAELAASGTRTERTVKMHLGGILEKLGLRDRLQLALLASEREHTQKVTN
jgi:two-component system nitrate/nitrite response regulator NarL